MTAVNWDGKQTTHGCRGNGTNHTHLSEIRVYDVHLEEKAQ